MTSRKAETLAETVARLDRELREVRGAVSVRGPTNPHAHPHSATTGQTANDHHPKSHAHNGADGSGTVSHVSLSGVTSDQHHPKLHAADHKRAGADEIDGDQLDIDWNPSNSTPATTPTEVSNVDHLTAHLYGIDQAIGALARGLVLIGSRSTNLTGLGAGPSDIINAGNFTFVSGRWYRLSGFVSTVERTATLGTGDRAAIEIWSGTTTRLARGFTSWDGSTGAFSPGVPVVTYLNTLSGSVNLRLRYTRTGGSFTASVRAAAAEEAWIVAEDLGTG